MDSSFGREYDHPFKLLADSEEADEINKKNQDDSDLGFFAKMVKAMGDEPS
jgi:hypothetical protein